MVKFLAIDNVAADCCFFVLPAEKDEIMMRTGKM